MIISAEIKFHVLLLLTIHRSSCPERVSSDSVLFCFQQYLQSQWTIWNSSYHGKEVFQIYVFFCSYEGLLCVKLFLFQVVNNVLL